jgi:CDP-diacylglycerol pyrophosphatase
MGSHRLVLPVAPCRGVEDWRTCGGEPIWDYAWGFTGGSDFGLAINPVQRRSQDQMHVHVAKLQSGLFPALQDVANKKLTTWTPIKCSSKVANGCKVDKTAKTSGLQAKFVQAGSPSAAMPFANVYSNPANEQDDVTVVSQPHGPGKGVVILRANDRPAECFLYCQDVCQDYCK